MKKGLFRGGKWRIYFTLMVMIAFSPSVLIHADMDGGNTGNTAVVPDWRSQDERNISAGERLIVPDRYRVMRLDMDGWRERLSRIPFERPGDSQDQHGAVVVLPHPDGGSWSFECVNSPIMEPELAAEFPEIATYRGQGIEDRTASLRMDVTPAGFHAMVLTGEGSVFIDPYQRGDIEHYIIYRKRALRPSDGFLCHFNPEHTDEHAAGLIGADDTRASVGPTLRTYRAAVAATGEYTAYHGGTVNAGMAAIVTTMNRVVGIYEREVCVRMVLVANNNLLVYTNATTDPYSNNDGYTMLGQNQTNIDAVIGSANYDIGHVFSTGGGGIAGLGVVCRVGQKARGVTGRGAPVGDPFDVDYVAHEMGHQFGANHTFNGTTTSCGGGNRNATTAYEPGSGSTIMAYAGICGAENLQAHSDAYFHVISYHEIRTYTHTGSGSGCPGTTSTGNAAPTVNAGASYIIPSQTPFMLTGSGSDPNGDALTWCWEEYDLGTAAPPNTDNGSRPIFRSFNPATGPSRIFPKLSDVLANTASFGESLPTMNRTMTYRLTARDNRSGGGGVEYSSTTVQISSAAGPFRVTAPNTNVLWNGNETRTVTWNVANTTASPVSCANVNIHLSTDGGLTFPTVLAAAVPNNGSRTITVPNVDATTARIKVQGAGNIFLDISDANFRIVRQPDPVPALSGPFLLALLIILGFIIVEVMRRSTVRRNSSEV